MKDEFLIKKTDDNKNHKHYEKLHKDRLKSGCEYSFLVSTLEPKNKLFSSGMTLVHEYPKMFVVRPGNVISAIITLRTFALEKLRLQKEIENALALAIAGVGATRAIRGTSAKHYYCGRAAESGVTANLLAMKGLTGPLDVFEDKQGIVSILNDNVFEHSYISDIGKEFSLLNPGVDIKKYPVCYASHAAADAVKSIIKSKNITIENVDKIICTVPPIIASNLTFHKPKSVKEAQFSLEFPIALMVKYGDIKLEHLSSNYILDPDIKNLINKVTMNVAKLPKRFKPFRTAKMFKMAEKLCVDSSDFDNFQIKLIVST